jgi:hypothetical protein
VGVVKITLHHRRLNGAAVMLVVTLAADGAIEFWRSEDPTTGASVELSSQDKWWAVLEIKRAAERVARGAA